MLELELEFELELDACVCLLLGASSRDGKRENCEGEWRGGLVLKISVQLSSQRLRGATNSIDKGGFESRMNRISASYGAEM